MAVTISGPSAQGVSLLIVPLGNLEPETMEIWCCGQYREDGHPDALLGGSWDLVSGSICTLIGVISNYNCSYLTYSPTY